MKPGKPRNSLAESRVFLEINKIGGMLPGIPIIKECVTMYEEVINKDGAELRIVAPTLTKEDMTRIVQDRQVREADAAKRAAQFREIRESLAFPN